MTLGKPRERACASLDRPAAVSDPADWAEAGCLARVLRWGASPMAGEEVTVEHERMRMRQIGIDVQRTGVPVE